MKIAYVIEDFSIKGGAERIIAEKANYLASTFHHDITIISIYHDENAISYELKEGVAFVSLNIPFTKKSKSLILTTIYRILTIIKVWVAFRKAINRIEPELIFYTMSLGAILLPLCKTKAKKVYESHLARSFTPYHQLFYAMEKKADKVICLTQGDAKEYKYAKDVVVIPNFIVQPEKCVKNYNIKKAIAVGRLEKQKGFDILINCWAKVSQELPDWHLDIYGEGSLHTKLQEQINKLQLQDKITLCGRVDHIMEIYTQYSIHIMSSRYEGQPMTLIEAQACGLPSICFDFQYGARDIIHNGYNGALIPYTDSDRLTEAIIKIASSESTRRILGEHACLIAKKYYREAIFSKWTKLIDSFSIDKE